VSKWIKIEDKKPNPNQEILAKFKHGIIKCSRDEEEENVGYLYMGDDREFYIYEWMPIELFEEWCDL
jgi:hypothetical protein